MVRVNDREQYATQPVKWNNLPSSTHEVLERFIAARLLISGGEGRTIEIAHVALVRAWPRLARWIEQDSEDLFVLRRAEIEAGEWERQGYDLRYLWHADWLKKLQELVSRGGGKLVNETVRLFMAPQDKLVARLEDTALSHQERFTIGQSLATMGDWRPGVGLKKDGLPDIEWIKIPGGQVRLEKVEHVFKVKPFRLAKYPVTNEQFEAFLKTEEGYGNKKWWKDIEQRNEADRPEWQDKNAPRETVTWFEAIAFSRWLSSRMKLKVRLPTEWEWQQAVTGGDPERKYPWEGGWDASRCNSDESRLRRTTAVGMYPTGATQQGVLDMVGNVWEWCLNTYEEADTTIATGGTRVVRGGSWDSARVYLRGSCRVWDDADFRGNVIGFRLAQDIDE